MLSGDIPGSSLSHASQTTSLKSDTFTQKISNWKISLFLGLSCWHNMMGQWSDIADKSTCNINPGSIRSHFLLQKTRSSRTNVGSYLSLLHVNLRFWRVNSNSSQPSKACLNLPMFLQFRFRLFLSLAAYIWLKSPKVTQGLAGLGFSEISSVRNTCFTSSWVGSYTVVRQKLELNLRALMSIVREKSLVTKLVPSMLSDC
jgi:hypothetical protein